MKFKKIKDLISSVEKSNAILALFGEGEYWYLNFQNRNFRTVAELKMYIQKDPVIGWKHTPADFFNLPVFHIEGGKFSFVYYRLEDTRRDEMRIFRVDPNQ